MALEFKVSGWGEVSGYWNCKFVNLVVQGVSEFTK